MKILLVEDARSVVQVMTHRLTGYGHSVVHAENGKVAVDLFAEVAPDLVLMDIEMPVMNGFEATNRIRSTEAQERWAWTPIIFLTSSDTVQNLVTAIEAGGDDFMSKFVPEPVLNAKMKAMARIAALRHSLSSANQKLQNLADHDGLTGLINRRSMDSRISDLWFEAVPNRLPLGLLMLDIDNFKKYNDQYGHHSGDDCLKAVASAVDTVVTQANATGLIQGAFVARYGGEEFVVVLPGVAQSVVLALAESLVQTVSQLQIAHTDNDGVGVVTISVGGAHLEHAKGDPMDLFRAADAQLYRAKSAGRNRAAVPD